MSLATVGMNGNPSVRDQLATRAPRCRRPDDRRGSVEDRFGNSAHEADFSGIDPRSEAQFISPERIVNGVLAVAAIEQVDVVTVVAAEHVIARATGNRVGADRPVQLIVSGKTGEDPKSYWRAFHDQSVRH